MKIYNYLIFVYGNYICSRTESIYMYINILHPYLYDTRIFNRLHFFSKQRTIGITTVQRINGDKGVGSSRTKKRKHALFYSIYHMSSWKHFSTECT